MNNYDVFKMLEQVIMVINVNMQRLNLQLQMLHKTKCHPDNLKKKNTARVTSASAPKLYIYVQIQREKEESAWVKYMTLKMTFFHNFKLLQVVH